MIYFLAIAASAFGRRIAGGAFTEITGRDIGDYPARAFWGFTCFAPLVTGHPWWWPVMAAAVFLGCAVPIHFREMGIGGTANGRGTQSAWQDVSGLTLHGIGNMALPALLMWWLGGAWWWPLLAGVTIAGWYEIGLRVGTHPRWPAWVRSAPQWAELAWGGACGAAIMAGMG